MGLNVGDGFAELIAVPNAHYTANGDSGILPGGGLASLVRAYLFCSAKTGTNPTLDVVLEDTPDGTNWYALGSFTQLTAAGSQAINITAALASRWRVRYTIGGTASPSFDFGVWVVLK